MFLLSVSVPAEFGHLVLASTFPGKRKKHRLDKKTEDDGNL